MAKSILTIVTKPPYGTEEAFAGFRLALSQIAGGIIEKSNVLMIEDGVFNALTTQMSDAIEMPSNREAISDLLDMECTIFCVREDLDERGIKTDKTIEGLSLISVEKVMDIVDEYDVTATF